jgi:serine/threonine protein kinase
MTKSEEFLRKIVEDRGLATGDKIAELVGAMPEDGEIHFATTIVRSGLLPEKELVTLLNTYGDQEGKAGNTVASENAQFGTKLAEKGLASGLELWTALSEQEKARAEGTEKSIDWFLSRKGSLDLGKSFEVLEEMGRKVVSCGDCGHREILPASAASSKPACPECRGIMKGAYKEEVPPKEAKTESDQLIGKELGGCVLEYLLGKGGMGAVYKARHLSLNKTVAVKVLSGALGTSSAKKRFLREARTAARLEHGNVVQVYDTGTEEDIYYIIMQFVEGETASDRVKREGPLSVDSAVEIILEAARGIGAAHRMGMIHRDIKPDNIMIDKKGEIRVADFGLAKELGEAATVLTAAGQAMGTPSYMSPEQARDASAVTHSTDIYSLGATLFTLLSGKPPFGGSSPWAVVSSAMNDPAPDIREFRSDVPGTLAEFILLTMEKDPETRPSDMAAFIDNLLAIQRRIGGEPKQTRPSEPVGKAHQTLNDLKTPAPGDVGTPTPPRTTDLMGPTLDDLPTPATIVPDRKGAPWLVPSVVVAVIVLAAVVVGALVVPGLRNGKTKPRPDDSSDPADSGKTPDRVVDEVLEAEAEEALRKAKSEADGHLIRDEFAEAVAVRRRRAGSSTSPLAGSSRNSARLNEGSPIIRRRKRISSPSRLPASSRGSRKGTGRRLLKPSPGSRHPLKRNARRLTPAFARRHGSTRSGPS